MLLAQKIELRPTQAQADYIRKACGTRRHAFNQLLAHFSQDGVKWSKASAYAHYMQVLRPAFPWYAEVTARAARNAVDDLDSAYRHFFRRCKAGGKPGYPRFKKKGQSDSFALREPSKFDVSGRSVRIERCPDGPVRMRQALRWPDARAKQVTISVRAGKVYAAFLVETDSYAVKDGTRDTIIGVDLGIKALAALSDGTVFPSSQALKKNLKRLKRRARNLSKAQRGSKRRAKAKLSLARLHKRIADQRSAVLHELTNFLTARYEVIVIEDLNVRGMVKNHTLAQSISDAGFGAFRAQLDYKARLRGNTLIVADRWYPSSKTCSACGEIRKDLSLAERTFRCPCGHVQDRDLNAARNLEHYGLDRLAPDLKRTQETGKPGSPAQLLTV